MPAYDDPFQLWLPVLDPLSLRFVFDSDEADYVEHFAVTKVKAADKLHWGISLMMNIVFSVSLLLRGSSGRGLSVMFTSTLVVQGAVMYMLPECLLIQHRTLRIGLFRVLADLLIALGLGSWLYAADTNHWTVICKHLVVHTGIFSMMYQSWSYLLPFKYALAAQAYSVSQFAMLVNGNCCALLTSEPIGMLFLSKLWDATMHICAATTLLGRLNLLDSYGLERIASQPLLLCHSTLLFLQISLGYALPMVILYALERRGRILFWCQLQQQPSDAVVASMRVSLASKVAAGLLMALAVVCAWEVSVVLLHSHQIYGAG